MKRFVIVAAVVGLLAWAWTWDANRTAATAPGGADEPAWIRSGRERASSAVDRVRSTVTRWLGGREAVETYERYATALATQHHGEAMAESVAAAHETARIRSLALAGRLAGRSERVHVGHAVEPAVALDPEGKVIAKEIPPPVYEILAVEVVAGGTVARIEAYERAVDRGPIAAKHLATVMIIDGVWKVTELAVVPPPPDVDVSP